MFFLLLKPKLNNEMLVTRQFRVRFRHYFYWYLSARFIYLGIKIKFIKQFTDRFAALRTSYLCRICYAYVSQQISLIANIALEEKTIAPNVISVPTLPKSMPNG